MSLFHVHDVLKCRGRSRYIRRCLECGSSSKLEDVRLCPSLLVCPVSLSMLGDRGMTGMLESKSTVQKFMRAGGIVEESCILKALERDMFVQPLVLFVLFVWTGWSRPHALRPKMLGPSIVELM